MLLGLKKMLPKYSPEIDKPLGAMWCDALRDFELSEIRNAFRYAAQNLTEWPAAATIKNICLGVTKDAPEIGQEISATILNCISKHGSWNAENARKDMGDLAWEVVKASGGWSEVCNITYEQLPSCKKQWRELATSYQKGYIRDGLNQPHKIPSKTILPDFLLN
jgi:hypothetical protein